ncbi:ATP phosphoribosyltransferase regulatory subunit [Aurantiacibacter gangjinensis]|uniref:tRNA synthetase class II n=1 Tax=Aurantiacibacter gangjinensis TaxID=502682 RepID=A0A0G9MMZ8_9SPHN|nr:ATP phosphoribosyltransferase regulatory subunit [Aurantiacibacter gangjinensis]APE28172.1 ATP phosphoribosyltransferase regulatory subunit [Aurantiacibacter gangjinensis]KLE32080.1 tRNA synthetase class II [Aurantiacibacter gangjinensis]
MTDPTQDLLPEGLEDRLVQSAAAATRIERAMLEAMRGHGYDRVRPPLIEFERSMAGRMDGVSTREMFRFVDPVSLRTLALRSDITPQLGRIASTGLADAARPLRLCYAGQVARITGSKLEPRREELQVGAELIGADSVAAASEVVELAIAALEAAGATGISVDFTLPDLVDTLADGPLPLDDAQRENVRRELDTKDAGGLVEAGGRDYLPLIHATGAFEDAATKLEALDTSGVLETRIAGLRDIAARIGDKARITLDPSERHGFEYQSWFGFTLYAENVRGAMGRGGTYCIAGTDEAATGFSLYPENLIEAVKGHEDTGKRLFLPLGHDRDAAAEARSEGWRTVAALTDADDAAGMGCSHRLDGGAIRSA